MRLSGEIRVAEFTGKKSIAAEATMPVDTAMPTEREAPLCLRLFGAGEIVVRGIGVPRPKNRKDFLLLALLALRQGQILNREWLAGVLWPDSEASQALYNLRRSLSGARDALREEAGRIASPTPRTLRFEAEGAHIDALLFDRLIQGRESSALLQAVALYRGPLLEGFEAPWAAPERNAREQAYLEARQFLAEWSLGEENWNEAAWHLRAVIEIDPLREVAQRGLMQALAGSGDVAAAVQAYRALRLRLHQELNVLPAAETIALYQRIQSAPNRTVSAVAAKPMLVQPSVAPARTVFPSAVTSPFTAMPAGNETVSESILAAMLESEILQDRAPGFLPQPITRLIGREQEAEEIWEQLRDARLVTLTGTGGVGKTRLAMHVAESNRAAFAQGAWFVDFSGLSRPEQVVPAIASALNVQETPGQQLETTLAAWLKLRHALLVLDNCEHLVQECARIVNALLQFCPPLKILAASRQPLGLIGEVTWRVPSLSLPGQNWEDATPTPEKQERLPELLASDAVLFFVERACQTHSDFRLTPQNAVSVARLCRRLDGIPLALELAAGRLRAMSLPQLVARLDDCFSLLTSPSSISTRQQTLRALIDWSVALLTPAENRLLRQLAVFAGGWTLEAAEAIAKDEGGRMKDEDREQKSQHPTPDTRHPLPPCLDVLTGLVDKSLVAYEERKGVGRYRLLETVRQYAAEQLAESGEEDALRARHAEYYLNFVLAWNRELEGAGQPAALNELHLEHGNFRAVLDACLRETTTTARDMGLRFVNALRRYWIMRDYFSEARFYLQAFLNHPAGPAQGKLRAEALNGLGAFCKNQGDRAAARACYEEALAWALGESEAELVARIQSNLSDVARAQGRYEEAQELLNATLEWARQTGDLYSEGRSLTGLGTLAGIRKDYHAALPFYEGAMEVARKMDNPHALGMSLLNCGTVRMYMGDYDAAQKWFIEALRLHRELNSKYNTAMALLCLARLAFHSQSYQEVRRDVGEALRCSIQVGDESTLAEELLLLSRVEAAQGNASLAARLWGMVQQLTHDRIKFIEPGEVEEAEQLVEELKQILGVEECATAIMRGRTLPRSQLLAEIVERASL